MTQTLALLMDTYRELNAKKLFWITLILSGAVAASLFLIGLTDTGIKVLIWEIDESWLGLSKRTIDPGNFYKMIFSDLALRFWLGIAAAALAIISTASLFPDMMKPGAIDLLLTKPIGRLRLFITRYLLGLGFAFLQVFVFTTICFFAMGIRGGAWEPGIFLAVPFFVLFFSYLFAVLVVVGVLTRSTIASLLITLIFFILLISLNLVDESVKAYRFMKEAEATYLEEHLAYAEKLEPEQLEELEEDYGLTLDLLRSETFAARESADGAGKFSDTLMTIKTPLPKTGETLAMLTRVIVDAADLPEPDAEKTMEVRQFEQTGVRSGSEVLQDTAEKLERPAWWVIGTSLLFEGVLLSIAGWKFCRRDY